MVDVSVLVGRTLKEVRRTGRPDDNDALVFVTTDGCTYNMYHSQDCCETVRIEDIAGDLEDLIGTPVLVAEERVSTGTAPVDEDGYDSGGGYTWTFYELRTIKGSVTIRGYGTSNGYYSEGVDFEQVGKPLAYGVQ
jgi:hypothetical protein